MHEWALAEGIISTATRMAQEEGVDRIAEVKVRIGELQQIDHEVLTFAIDQQRTSMVKKAKFIFESVPARLMCRVCGERWNFSPKGLAEEVSEAIHTVPEMAHAYLNCPKCGSPDFEIAEGRGVWLASIKGVKKNG